ncbi:hypothetical protein [Helicobacter pylori]|uniref:hypothetical protein n=1 Tax=Helicobacter pylori TaxID=210 RepID=UPI001E45BEF1|nr:hypothetical protein [Helicobacter pylori]
MKNLVLFLLGVGYKKILHFLRLDSRELIQAVFLKRSLGGDFSCRGELFQNTPYFIKKKFKIKFKHTILKVKEPIINTSLRQSSL